MCYKYPRNYFLYIVIAIYFLACLQLHITEEFFCFSALAPLDPTLISCCLIHKGQKLLIFCSRVWRRSSGLMFLAMDFKKCCSFTFWSKALVEGLVLLRVS